MLSLYSCVLGCCGTSPSYAMYVCVSGLFGLGAQMSLTGGCTLVDVLLGFLYVGRMSVRGVFFGCWNEGSVAFFELFMLDSI